jgi:hypothetical protein
LRWRRLGHALCVAAACFPAACGSSRYRADECPGDPLPEAKAILGEPGFDRLQYFRGTDQPLDRVDVETWADAQFDFSASLTYEYPALAGRRSDCARGVTLVVRLPSSEETDKLRDGFIDLFARRLRADLGDMKSAAVAQGSRGGDLFLEPVRFDKGELVGEVAGIDSHHRGRFLSVGFYDRDYDRSLRHAP